MKDRQAHGGGVLVAVMFVLSCEPATCAIPEWHKELFRGHEEIVTSEEGWSPGSLNLAQAFATKLRALLAHGDISRLLVDFSRHPDDPERFSRFSRTLSDEQRHKLDERHHRAYLNVLKQRIAGEQRRIGAAIHLSLRTAGDTAAAVEFRHSGTREIESRAVELWVSSLRASAPEITVATATDEGYGLSRYLRDEHPDAFGSLSVVVARSSFLEGQPVRWETLKKHLIATMPQPG